MDIATTIVVFVGIFFIICLIMIISSYNRLVRLRNNNSKAFSNIDVLLKQRSDELPKLVNTVKGYVKHEKELLEKVTKLRSNLNNSHSVKDKSNINNEMQGVVKSIFAVAEKYPELKANKNFLELQKRITSIEDMIADRREFFNDSVNIYNIRTQEFPTNILANMFGFKQEDLFKASDFERKDVTLDL